MAANFSKITPNVSVAKSGETAKTLRRILIRRSADFGEFAGWQRGECG